METTKTVSLLLKLKVMIAPESEPWRRRLNWKNPITYLYVTIMTPYVLISVVLSALNNPTHPKNR